MANDSDMKNKGVMEVVLDRLSNRRLPRALDIKDKVDQGEVLSDNDIDFLERVLEDSKEIKRYVDQSPEYQDLYVKAVDLYEDITAKALENEKKSGA